MSFLQDERLSQVSDPAIAALLRDLLNGQSELLQRVSEIEGELQKQAAASAAVVAAFPNGDMAGHRRYHELMIEDIESRKRLWRAITEKTLGGLLWGTMAMVAAAVWFYIKAQVMR